MTVPGSEWDVRPAVGRTRRDLPLVVVALLVAASAVALFMVLNARRHASGTQSTAEKADFAGMIRPAPPLAVPPPPPVQPAATASPTSMPTSRPAPAAPVPPTYAQQPYVPPPTYQPASPPAPQTYFPPQSQPERTRSAGQGDSPLVIDNTVGEAAGAAASSEPGPAVPGGAGATPQRSRAVRSRQRDTIVAQGALIPAVLESALNSSQPGLARAIVSRDVRGFDGTRVLIPRGSRLIGEYRSDLTPGQKRAFLNWTRLVRPDGASVSLGSPASDPLGRAGIAGKVDNHFFERFGSAILRSILDIGVNVASARIGDSPVIVGLPGSVGGGISQSVAPGAVAPPTLTVRQGTAISVFVARDLDFTAVEARP